MQLASVEVIPYALPFKRPYVTARGTLTQREMVMLRLRSEDGVVGLGEAVPLSLRGGQALEAVVEELKGLEHLETFDEQAATSLSAPARCAVLTALMDLRGRLASEAHATDSEPVPVPCNATLVAGMPVTVAADAERWAAEGFSTFKLKLGRGEDVAQVRAVREALGPAARIRIDANASWSVAEAAGILSQLEELKIELAEQPVGSLEEMAKLAELTSIPLAGDESVTSTEEAERAASLGACRYTGVKLAKVGGPEEALSIADVLPAYVTSALDGPVGIAAAAQVAQTLRETDHPERLDLAHGLATQRLFTATVASVECELRGDQLHLPPGPGLGVEIDEESLQAHRL